MKTREVKLVSHARKFDIVAYTLFENGKLKTHIIKFLSKEDAIQHQNMVDSMPRIGVTQ